MLKLLEMFRENPVHMAVVVDEYGVLEGIVTPTDILIAIAGELPEDVSDLEEAPLCAATTARGSWTACSASTRRSGCSSASDMRGDEDFETLAGFVLARLARIPQIGDHFEWDGLRFEIVDMDGRRIDRILVASLFADA